MNTYEVTVKYTVENTYTVEAPHPEAAENETWREVNADTKHATSYGNWEVVSITEREEI